MRRMSDPGYVYQPWSEERREKARQASLQRLGAAPPGFRIVFGVPVRDAIWREVRDAANKYHYLKQGRSEPLWKTRAVVLLLVELLSQGTRQE